MGCDKALVRLRNIPLLQHVAENLGQVLNHRLIVANDGADYTFLDLPIVSDVFKGHGPLGGIHSALLHASTPACLIMSCDVPFASPPVMRYLIAEQHGAPITVPSLNGQVHPLCGIYRKTLLPLVEQHLEAGKTRMHDLLSAAGANIVPIGPELSFFTPLLLQNINRREDLEEVM